MDELQLETLAVRAGRKDNATALAPILWATTTFVTPTVAEGRRMATTTGANRFYTRYGNPTVRGFEEAVATLEGAEDARAFASGMGAITAVVLAAAGVFGTGTAWPDLIVAGVMAGLGLIGGAQIIRHAMRELSGPAASPVIFAGKPGAAG